MDPKFLMEAMKMQMDASSKGGKGPIGDMDEAGIKNMMQTMEAVQKDPSMMKQMEGMWKMMDEMHTNNPDEYKKFVAGNMKEMNEHHVEEKKEEDSKSTINSYAYFTFSVRPCKLKNKADKKAETKEMKDEIKIFDFVDNDMKESFAENPDKLPPLDTHKLYLNIVYHEAVLPPLNDDKTYADEKNDATWRVIPVAFTEPWERTNVEDCRVLTYDGHISKAVHDMMKSNKDKFHAILHYIVQKFQSHVEDTFVLSKNSMKLKKKAAYKDGKGTGLQRPRPYVLKKQMNKKEFKAMREKVVEEIKRQNPDAAEKKPLNVQTSAPDTIGQEPEFKMRVPGQKAPVEKPAGGKVLIQEMKEKPVFTVTFDDERTKMIIVLEVEMEDSAKNFDLDVSKTHLMLISEHYEMNVKLEADVDPDSIKAKFSKAKKTLTLTLKTL